MCIADSLDREKLAEKLRDRGQRYLLESHADVLYGKYHNLDVLIIALLCISSNTCLILPT